MKAANVQGVFVAVVKGDSVLYQKNFGVADKENSKAMSAETCMELGSISKAFTAEAIYVLHQQQLLNIDDPITKYLPEAPAKWSAVTIRHLLAHTSGIQNYLLDPRFKAAEYFGGTKDTAAENFINNVSSDSLLQMFYTLPFEFTTGASWSYSNTGYIILGKIAEKITGKNFFELVQEKLTSPLQMHHTAANDIAARRGCLAKGYFIKDNSLLPSRVLKTNYAFSAGAWASTGRDMINYLKA
ncbi:MAG: beta-lactamase family protein, partial [Bacteroidota bacterium]|nr:beta-lactamase family protein [Bacteroidota bacterium]